jgi:hypothetical protein
MSVSPLISNAGIVRINDSALAASASVLLLLMAIAIAL